MYIGDVLEQSAPISRADIFEKGASIAEALGRPYRVDVSEDETIYGSVYQDNQMKIDFRVADGCCGLEKTVNITIEGREVFRCTVFSNDKQNPAAALSMEPPGEWNKRLDDKFRKTLN